MENKSKAETFIGFAMRTGKFCIGAGLIDRLKEASIIIVCKTAAENSLQKARKLSKKLNCPCYITVEKTLAEITHKEKAKIMAIYDKNLAKAIIENIKQDFILEAREN